MLNTLDDKQIVEEWKLAKNTEKAAAARRLAVEVEIYNRKRDLLKPEGTNNFEHGLKVITKYNYKFDEDKLDQVFYTLPDIIKTEWPFAQTWKPSISQFKKFMLSHPDIASQIATISEAKPTFSVGDDKDA